MIERGIVKAMEWLLMLILGLMVVLVFANVVLRYGFNYGIVFSEEVSRFLFVWMVFLGSLLLLRENGHLGVHTLITHLSPGGKKICKFLGDGLTLFCCVLLSIGAWRVVAMNMVNMAPVSGIPLGVVFFACLLCSVGMGLLLLRSIFRLLTGRMTEQEMFPDVEDNL